MPKTYPTMSTNVWQVLSPSSQIEAFNKDSLLAIREGGQWVVRLNTIQSHWVKMDETRAEVADSWCLILQLQHSLVTKNDQNWQGQFFHRYQIQFPNLFRWISFSWVWEYSFFFFLPRKILHQYAAAAESLQSSPTLCDPMDCTPFSRQENWSGLPCPPPGALPDPGSKTGSLALQVDAQPGKPLRQYAVLCYAIWLIPSILNSQTSEFFGVMFYVLCHETEI